MINYSLKWSFYFPGNPPWSEEEDVARILSTGFDVTTAQKQNGTVPQCWWKDPSSAFPSSAVLIQISLSASTSEPSFAQEWITFVPRNLWVFHSIKWHQIKEFFIHPFQISHSQIQPSRTQHYHGSFTSGNHSSITIINSFF